MKNGDRKREATLKWITDYFIEHGYAPSFREIMAGMGFKSLSSVQAYMNAMIDRGEIISNTKAGSPRAFTVSGYRFTKDS